MAVMNYTHIITSSDQYFKLEAFRMNSLSSSVQ